MGSTFLPYHPIVTHVICEQSLRNLSPQIDRAIEKLYTSLRDRSVSIDEFAKITTSDFKDVDFSDISLDVVMRYRDLVYQVKLVTDGLELKLIYHDKEKHGDITDDISGHQWSFTNFMVLNPKATQFINYKPDYIVREAHFVTSNENHYQQPLLPKDSCC